MRTVYAIIASKGMYENRCEWTIFISSSKNKTLSKAEELRNNSENCQIDSLNDMIFYSVVKYYLDYDENVIETKCI